MKTEELMNLDVMTAKGIGYALDMWQRSAIAAMQAMVTGQEDWSPAAVARQSFELADAMLAEAAKRIPAKMDELIKLETEKN